MATNLFLDTHIERIGKYVYHLLRIYYDKKYKMLNNRDLVNIIYVKFGNHNQSFYTQKRDYWVGLAKGTL